MRPCRMKSSNVQGGSGAVININGRPAGLDGYLPSKLYQAKDPIQTFETWTDHIVRKIKSRNLTFNLKPIKKWCCILNRSSLKRQMEVEAQTAGSASLFLIDLFESI